MIRDETRTPQNLEPLQQPEITPSNPIGLTELLSNTPENDALRDAVFNFTSSALQEKNLISRATDENGEVHELRGNDIVIEPVENEPKARILNKYTEVVIGVFLLGGLLTAIGKAHYHHKE